MLITPAGEERAGWFWERKPLFEMLEPLEPTPDLGMRCTGPIGYGESLERLFRGPAGRNGS